MPLSKTLKATLFVCAGSVSFAVFGPLVKFTQKRGYSLEEIIFAEALFAVVPVMLLNLFVRKNDAEKCKLTSKEKLLLGLHGVCIGLISLFYLLTIQLSSPAVAIVLLSQSIWINIVAEGIQTRIFPSAAKIWAIAAVLTGTILVTRVFAVDSGLSLLAIVFGALSALANSTSVYLSSTLVKTKAPLRRTLFLSLGFLVVITAVYAPGLAGNFDSTILFGWGILIGITGFVLPTLCFLRGMPVIGPGLSGIIVCLQIPLAAIFAMMLLADNIGLYQWLGILMIIAAIVCVNRFKPGNR
ncbi:hypothetical protein C7T94_07820 [Pedobacter yulinensis]|uniref:EamA domain-containing protein n=1 Tax=Pedobacter yulinensis TaxID=2126353 RepID=A0A2T3HJF2_9SPHI|nr:DMT family transporter [Pedobacter yulinensis]PST82567.1 hypothetical protein C7T94_07820 [Pedobacter yulinensis]